MASQDISSEDGGPTGGRHRALSNSRSGRAALLAAALCVLGMLALLVGLLGWWSVLAAPAYLATTVFVAMLSRGHTQAFLAVALSTALMGILVALIKLTGLA